MRVRRNVRRELAQVRHRPQWNKPKFEECKKALLTNQLVRKLLKMVMMGECPQTMRMRTKTSPSPRLDIRTLESLPKA